MLAWAWVLALVVTVQVQLSIPVEQWPVYRLIYSLSYWLCSAAFSVWSQTSVWAVMEVLVTWNPKFQSKNSFYPVGSLRDLWGSLIFLCVHSETSWQLFIIALHFFTGLCGRVRTDHPVFSLKSKLGDSYKWFSDLNSIFYCSSQIDLMQISSRAIQ